MQGSEPVLACREWPLSRKVAEAYSVLLDKLQPLFAAIAKARAALEAWWELRVDRLLLLASFRF